MSLSLLQGYSSAEEEEEDDKQAQFLNSSDEDDDGDEVVEEEALNNNNNNNNNSYTKSVFDLAQQQQKSVDSGLPSALDAFSEITGPPRFLNSSIVEEEHPVPPEHVAHRRHRRHRKDNRNKNLPAGVVVEAKSQLVGMHERVRSDVGGNVNGFPRSSSSSMVNQSQKDLLSKEAEKKKGSTVKDKEKNKRMKGQSSHATWKSETEMHLRQQFD